MKRPVGICSDYGTVKSMSWKTHCLLNILYNKLSKFFACSCRTIHWNLAECTFCRSEKKEQNTKLQSNLHKNGKTMYWHIASTGKCLVLAGGCKIPCGMRENHSFSWLQVSGFLFVLVKILNCPPSWPECKNTQFQIQALSMLNLKLK
jgi:hypothetical protein